MTFATLKKFFRSRIKREPPSIKSPKPEPGPLPWGLSRDQLNQIQALTEMIPYKHYLAAVEHLYENNLSAMLRGLTHDAYLFQCGVCFALEQIAALPGDLALKLRESDARHTTDSTGLSADASAVFVNTPFWDAYQQRGARQYGSAGVPIHD